MKRTTNYLLFIDESGTSGFSDGGEHFLLSGLIINKDLHIALSSYMISLKEKSNIPADENTHAFDLFEGERRKMIDKHGRLVKDKNGATKHKRIPYLNIQTFFKRLSSLIEGANIHCFILRQSKKPYQKLIRRTAKKKGVSEKLVTNYLKRKQLNDFLYESLVRKMILEFGHFLEGEDAYGEVMAESRQEGDEVVLRAFISAKHESTFGTDSRYRAWAGSSFKRIHGLTFQNKKGLSFGLEIADLFSWAHLNKKHGRKFPISSAAKQKRVESRLKKVDEMMRTLYYKKKPEDITRSKLETVAGDKVSKFTEALKQYKAPSVPLGTSLGNPSEP